MNYMSYFLVTLFVILLIPIVLKEYKDIKESSYTKILNLVISLFLLYLFTSTTKKELVWAFDQTIFFKDKIFVEIGILTPILCGTTWLLHVTISFILSAMIVLIVLRREKSRKLFIKTLPVYWISNSINFYKFIILKKDEVSAFEYIIPVILILNGIFVILIYIFYTRKFVKKLFH